MEVMTQPPPPQDFMLDTSGAYPPEPVITNPFAASSADDAAAGNPFLTTAVTAPPSPNPFEHLPPGASDADPFDLFRHFTSAPASPARAAAGNVVGGGDGDGFQPRVSYSTVTSTVPFEWEEKPGKPKPEFASVTSATADDTADFDFGVLLDKAAQAQELTTADELFDEGKIRPLKPPPRLLDGAGSVGSSPRSARSVIWSPRLRGTRGRNAVGPGADFDPFAAALEKAAKAPSSLGIISKDVATGGVDESASSPMNPADPAATSPTSTTPAANNSNDVGRRKKWRLSDLLLFRRASGKGRATGGNISKDPVFKYAPVQQLSKDANAEPVAANGDASSVKPNKQSKKEGGMPVPRRQNMMGCIQLHPGLHRLAKGFNGHSVHLGGRSNARSAMKG